MNLIQGILSTFGTGYWNVPVLVNTGIFLVYQPVLPENMRFMFFRTCLCFPKAHNTEMKKMVGKSVQVPDTGTRVLDNSRPFLRSSIVSFWITLARSEERKYHNFG